MEIWCHGAADSTSPFIRLVSPLTGSIIQKFEAGFAYVSLSGAIKLEQAIESSPEILAKPKNIYVGLHHGITEPKAIARLMAIPGARVFFVTPTRDISKKSLVMHPLYHPKYCVAMTTNAEDHWLIGSANLTGAAVGLGGNIEMACISRVTGPEKIAARKAVRAWQRVYSPMLLQANSANINQYTLVRKQFLKDNPVIKDEIETTEDLSIAKKMFIDVGAASGMQRHQVEFPGKVANFFGVLPTARRNLVLQRGTQTWADRPLTPKTTTFNVDIYRLGMPTIKKGGEAIAQRAIRFTRNSDSDGFDFEIEDVNGTKYKSWLKECKAQGGSGSTAGGRAYGYVY